MITPYGDIPREGLAARGRPGLEEAHATLAPLVTREVLEEAVRLVMPDWFGEYGAADYVAYLSRRAAIVPEVIRT